MNNQYEFADDASAAFALAKIVHMFDLLVYIGEDEDSKELPFAELIENRAIAEAAVERLLFGAKGSES